MNSFSYAKSGAIITALIGFSLPLFFQNCSQIKFNQYLGELSDVSSESLDRCVDPKCGDIVIGLASCVFDGQILPSGETITTYLEPQGETCTSEVRTCLNGNLTGTYQYTSCTVIEPGEDPPKSCLFGSKTIAHGESIKAFQNSTVPFGNSCIEEDRKCEDGALSGSYQHESCTVGSPNSCLFNGSSVEHGSVITAYQNSSVPFGEECKSELRLCENGSLNGSYQYSSCEPGAPDSCLFHGSTIPHLGTVKAYQNSSVGFGEDCLEEDRVCTNGVLSGSYNHLSCEVGAPRSCTFDGKDVAHGQIVKAFKTSSVPFGEVCVEEDRLCMDGELSGSFQKPSCNIGEPLTCEFNGKDVAHGQKVKAFKSSSVPYGASCELEDRLCTNGNLSGSYTFESCNVGSPNSCQFKGQTVAHGQKISAYLQPSVPYGSVCQAEQRECVNGVLSGSASHSSCSVGSPAHCILNGQTIMHGQFRVAYSSSSVPYGSSCQSQTRTCNNGNLSGSYTHLTCTVQAPPSDCTLNGQTVRHGQSVVRYSSSSVPYGSSCQSQTRTCNNGSLSGSYTHSTCVVQSGASCNFNGATIAHGSSVTAYAEPKVAFGKTCKSQSRKCTNGSLSGSYTHNSCSVTAANAVCTTAEKTRWGNLAKQNNNEGRVNWVYCEFLGRYGEPAGFNHWMWRLNSGGRSAFCSEAMAAALAWEKCSSRNPAGPTSSNSCYDSPETIIKNAYKLMFKRSADSAGLNYHLSVWNARGSNTDQRRTALTKEMCESSEFRVTKGYGPYF